MREDMDLGPTAAKIRSVECTCLLTAHSKTQGARNFEALMTRRDGRQKASTARTNGKTRPRKEQRSRDRGNLRVKPLKGND